MPRQQLTLPFSAIRNADFLSNHWLEKRLQSEPEWSALRETANAALSKLEVLWEKEKDKVAKYDDEAGLEHAFIQPVLDALGWKIKYQPFLQGREPDYALFLSEDDHSNAIHAGRKSPDFWKFPKLLADAKAWHISLDRPTTTASQREFPPQQIEWYLNNSQLDYAILTNGQLWRLIPRNRASNQARFQTYLEANLADILKRYTKNHLDYDNVSDFYRFFLFFSPRAFTTQQNAETLITRAIAGSSAYRLSASEGLKDRVFQALGCCIEGFLNHKPNALDPPGDFTACRANSFTLLFRLLFIFFAEDRQLLPYRKNQLYTANRSLSRFRDEIARNLDRAKGTSEIPYSKTSTSLWQDVTQLFDLIDAGKAAYAVPAYNGGLFNADTHPFLQTKALPDFYLARVIDSLGRAVDPQHPDDPPFSVDYKDLAIQDLGNIYEGLLEVHPRYQSTAMKLVVRASSNSGRREERIIPDADPVPKGFEVTERYPAHTVHLATDKGERRASGSYYTPDHIVNYIVENTLGPLCRDIDQKLNTEIAKTEADAKGKRGRDREIFDQKLAQLRADFDDRVLALKVLDPAMGSGHFLIRACQFLAEEIATNPHTKDSGADALVGPNADDASTIIFWKRKVVENCLYGVDLNPVAVELAKLALWLETVSTTQPLSFLDHHLRHGNSLVGAFVDQLDTLPGELAIVQNAFQNQIAAKLPILLGTLNQIRGLPSDTIPDVKKKEKLFLQTVESERAPFRQIADVWISAYFLDSFLESVRSGPDSPLKSQISNLKSPRFSATDYNALVGALGSSKSFTPVRDAAALELALAAIKPVAPFHWEIEFPDVFYSHQGRLPNPGFQAIIGNPPYDVLSEKENKTDLSALQAYIKDQVRLAPSVRGKNNLYKLFICQAISLLGNDARMGFITPMAILGDDSTSEVRKAMFGSGRFSVVDAFPQKDNPKKRVFSEAKLSTAVFGFIKSAAHERQLAEFPSRSHPANLIEELAVATTLSESTLSSYDPANLSIVSCTQDDWAIAVRLSRSGRVRRLHEFAAFSQGEVNETNERAKGSLAPANKGKLVTRGAGICLYVPRDASQGDDIWLNVEQFLKDKSPETKAFDHKQRRIGWQESCPQNNFRRVIASLIPQGEFCNHKINYLPEGDSKLPLEFALGLLNSKLTDWYFRLGSTNAAVSHYQIGNLPVPLLASAKSSNDRELFNAAKAALDAKDFLKVLALLQPACQSAPFPLAIQDIIIAAVERIILIEKNRGEISRTDRSHLDPAAQPYQDLIDQLFFRMAGLTLEESTALEVRLRNML